MTELAIDWQRRAACIGAEPELFFPVRSAEQFAVRAKRVCRRCPVLRDCLQYALTWDVDGVWGATTKAERDELRAKHRISAHPVEVSRSIEERRNEVSRLSGGGCRSRRSPTHSASATPPSGATSPTTDPGVVSEHDEH